VGGAFGVHVGVYADGFFLGGGEGAEIKVTMSQSHKSQVQRFALGVLFFLWTMVYGLSTTCAQPASSATLINNAKEYDGKIVSYAGEAVGEVMRRGAFAWVNLGDGKNAIGCWVTGAQASQIEYTGSSTVVGDWVEVIGVFNRACREHGGDLDIHAHSLRSIAKGHRVSEPRSDKKREAVFILSGALCLTLILSLFRRKAAQR
jgi:hypothetical protein